MNVLIKYTLHGKACTEEIDLSHLSHKPEIGAIADRWHQKMQWKKKVVTTKNETTGRTRRRTTYVKRFDPSEYTLDCIQITDCHGMHKGMMTYDEFGEVKNPQCKQVLTRTEKREISEACVCRQTAFPFSEEVDA